MQEVLFFACYTCRFMYLWGCSKLQLKFSTLLLPGDNPTLQITAIFKAQPIHHAQHFTTAYTGAAIEQIAGIPGKFAKLLTEGCIIKIEHARPGDTPLRTLLWCADIQQNKVLFLLLQLCNGLSKFRTAFAVFGYCYMFNQNHHPYQCDNEIHVLLSSAYLHCDHISCLCTEQRSVFLFCIRMQQRRVPACQFRVQ